MKITLEQTASKEDLGNHPCCICKQRFYLGPVTCLVISEESNILWGVVCPACLERGPEYIQEKLDRNAWWAWQIAEQETEEGISDCPTLEEFLAAEAFYQRPRFQTGEEYWQALREPSGEID